MIPKMQEHPPANLKLYTSLKLETTAISSPTLHNPIECTRGIDWSRLSADGTETDGFHVYFIQGGPKVVTQTFGLIAQRFVPH